MCQIVFLLCIITVSCKGWSDTRVRYFPEEFMFGAASSAYQVEGASADDGKGESIWDRFTHSNPYATVDKSNADVSADSYHKYEKDVQILKDMHLNFYKLSISWSRVLPNGLTNSINEKGLKYYENIINALIKNQIEPMVTLYHYDLPQYLQNLGGWTNSSMVDHFVNYARVVFDNFGDKVSLWVTVHNPLAVCQKGYGDGTMAPGGGQNGVDEYICTKNVLMAHAKVWHLYNDYRKKNKGKGKIGISLNMDWKEQFSNDTEQVRAVEEARLFYYGLYIHPIFSKTGDFPKAVKDVIASKSESQGFQQSRLPKLSSEEIKLIKGTSDFLGLSHFTTETVYRNDSLKGSFISPSFADDLNVGLTSSPEWVKSPVSKLRCVPYGLYKILIWINLQYQYPEIIITELGWPSGPGLNDEQRIFYLRNYMDALLLAMEDGSRVRGLAVWSLIDTFEWNAGYTERFGLYEVDFDSAEKIRTARKSALVYFEVIRSRWVDHNYNPKLTDKPNVKQKIEL